MSSSVKRSPEENTSRWLSWRKRNPEKADLIRRRQHYKKYNLTVEQYEQMFANQGGGCSICGQRQERRLAIDHDHETGKVRGLLCHTCNVGLGNFHDLPTLLRRAIAYLERST